MKKRIFVFVLDGFGVGEAPDAKLFGDVGSNTYVNMKKVRDFNLPYLERLGLNNIDGLNLTESTNLIGSYGKMQEKSMGKDTTTGHFEMMGIISKIAMPTFPKGFPQEIISKLEKEFGNKILANKVSSGTAIIEEYGKEHLKTGYPIVYTSADSVLQIATHINVVPLNKLYEMCEKARKIMSGKYGVGRIIARPFEGEIGAFQRIAEGRRDYAIAPSENNSMCRIKNAGKKVVAVGKISEIFANVGITDIYENHTNLRSYEAVNEIVKQDFEGLVFINLVDTDMQFGHRNNIDGYIGSLKEFDNYLKEFMIKMNEQDVLIVCADHGNDPTTESTDHSREFVPLLVYGNNIKQGVNMHILNGFDNLGKFAEDYLIGNTKSLIGEMLCKK